ncbi:hypothetical protein K2W90_07030 [Candidatus Babeliales bacterium]|nr:hypothetical protein [Candidatus Babeliales bacterium]
MHKYFFLFLSFSLFLPTLHPAAPVQEPVYKQPMLDSIAKIVRFTFLCLPNEGAGEQLIELKKALKTFVIKLYSHLGHDSSITQADYSQAYQRYDMCSKADPYLQKNEDKQKWAKEFQIGFQKLKDILPDINAHAQKTSRGRICGDEMLKNLEELTKLVKRISTLINQEYPIKTH